MGLGRLFSSRRPSQTHRRTVIRPLGSRAAQGGVHPDPCVDSTRPKTRSLGERTLMSRESALVTADWAEQNLDADHVVFVEVDEDTTAYDGGHIPGAVKINWKTELQDPVVRDFVDRAGVEKLLSEKGIGNGDTVGLYGGNNNWFAAYAHWEFKLYG